MGLYKFNPPPSGRMGNLWTLSTIRGAALMEFGCMGHMLYARSFLERMGAFPACKLYSTHLSETDIALGTTDRLFSAITAVIQQDKPRAIFLIPSSVPEIIGTDLEAIFRELQPDFPKTTLIPFGKGGFEYSVSQGVQDALLRLVKAIPMPISKTDLPSFNLIGSCADMFNFKADAAELIRILDGAFGLKPLCVLTSDTSLSDIEKMGGAHINICIRREGEAAAKHLEREFGTPFISARPYGAAQTVKLIKAVAQKLGKLSDKGFIDSETAVLTKIITATMPLLAFRIQQAPESSKIFVGGHTDVVSGITAFAGDELKLPRGESWCDCPEMAEPNLPFLAENEWLKLVKSCTGILMASGDAASQTSGRFLQIANPDKRLRLNPFVPPLVGFRGALNIIDFLANAIVEK